MDTKIEIELRVLRAYAVVASLLIIALFVLGAPNEQDQTGKVLSQLPAPALK
jgi:hypothetical protein